MIKLCGIKKGFNSVKLTINLGREDFSKWDKVCGWKNKVRDNSAYSITMTLLKDAVVVAGILPV